MSDVANDTERKVNYLNNTKRIIMNSLKDRGIIISEEAPFRTYPSYVSKIQQGDVSCYFSTYENYPSVATSIKGLKVNKWKTENLTSLSRMFQNCSGLIELDLSTFKTNNVTDFSSMFSGCGSLKKLNLKGWNNHKMTTCKWMFSACYDLTELEFPYDWYGGTNDEMILDFSNLFDLNKTSTLNTLDRLSRNKPGIIKLNHEPYDKWVTQEWKDRVASKGWTLTRV